MINSTEDLRSNLWGLRFIDSLVEADYQARRDENILPYARIGLIGGCIAALCALIASYFGVVASNRTTAIWVVAVILLQHAAGIWIISTHRWRRWAMTYIALIHSFGGFAAVVISQPTNSVTITTACVSMAAIFGFVLFRLPPVHALLAITPYVVLGQYLATVAYMNGRFDHQSLIFSIFMPTTILLAGFIACLAFERITRENYRAQMIIERQTKTLNEERANLSKFLSPAVAQLVREQGIATTLQQQVLPITAICCDLRGFTAYTQKNGAEKMVSVLREYYATIVDVAARFGGTIKDFAGDGALIIIGAPVRQSDHAQVGLDLARDLLRSIYPLISRTSDKHSPLGIGAGVGTGQCAVGAIAAQNQLIYTAVGNPVNLAARLCASALHGQVLISPETMKEVAHNPSWRKERLELKGVDSAEPVAIEVVG